MGGQEKWRIFDCGRSGLDGREEVSGKPIARMFHAVCFFGIRWSKIYIPQLYNYWKM